MTLHVLPFHSGRSLRSGFGSLITSHLSLFTFSNPSLTALFKVRNPKLEARNNSELSNSKWFQSCDVSLSIIDLLFSKHCFEFRYSKFPLVTTRGVAVLVYDILLGIPEVLLRFIWLLVLPLPLQGGEAFGFLGSPARRIRALAAGEESGASDQANELKVLHTA